MCGMCLPHCPTYHVTRDEAESPRGRLSRLWQRSGAPAWARRLGLRRNAALARLDAVLPPLPPIEPWQPYYPARGTARGDVALFLGCVSDLADRGALHGAIHVLTHCGYGVHVPPAQTCCGALHQHQGDAATAQQFARRNQAAFARPDLLAILPVASGCGAALNADILVTSNIGCALHLRAGLIADGSDITIMHPVELLARQFSAAQRDEKKQIVPAR